MNTTRTTGTSPDSICARFAERQHGVFSRAQALKAGVGAKSIHRRVTSGRWERVLPSVYRITGTGGTWHQRLMAAVLWAGPGAVISHRAAAGLWGIEGFENARPELIVCRRVTACARDIVVHQVSELGRKEVTTIDAIPVTRAPRTLVDLAAVVGLARVEAALDEALRRPVLTVELELRKLMLAENLPVPATAFELRHNGKALELDLAYPQWRIAIEADSFRFHTQLSDFERDRERLNVLAELDWQVLHVTWRRMKLRPRELAMLIRRSLIRAGWPPD